jgi:hypothetical protein
MTLDIEDIVDGGVGGQEPPAGGNIKAIKARERLLQRMYQSSDEDAFALFPDRLSPEAWEAEARVVLTRNRASPDPPDSKSVLSAKLDTLRRLRPALAAAG